MTSEQIVRVLLEDEDEFSAKDYFSSLEQWHEVWHVSPKEVKEFMRKPDPDTGEAYRTKSVYRRKRGSLTMTVIGTREQTWADTENLNRRLQQYLDAKFNVKGGYSPFYVQVWSGYRPEALQVDIIKADKDRNPYA